MMKRMPLALKVIQKKVLCSAEKNSVIWAEPHGRSSAKQFGRTKRLSVNTFYPILPRKIQNTHSLYRICAPAHHLTYQNSPEHNGIGIQEYGCFLQNYQSSLELVHIAK